MEKIIQLIRNVQSCQGKEFEKLSELIRKLQRMRSFSMAPEYHNLIFYGIALALEKLSDHKVNEVRDDQQLQEINQKIVAIKNEVGLEEGKTFESGNPNSPEEYQALNAEYNYRIDEIKFEIMLDFAEEEIGRLFSNNRKSYLRKYYKGWKALEADNPKVLEEITKQELAVQKEFLFP